MISYDGPAVGISLPFFYRNFNAIYRRTSRYRKIEPGRKYELRNLTVAQGNRSIRVI
jgi:hypothetical protein